MNQEKRISNKGNEHLLMSVCRMILLFLFLILMESCSSSDPYPQNWGAVYDTDKHGDSVISGVYNCQGECSQVKLKKYTLADLIELPDLPIRYSDYNNVIIKLDKKDKLIIILRRDTDTTFRTIFPENKLDFSFTDEGLELKAKSIGKSADDYSAGSAKVYLMKGENGSLIVLCKSQSFGFLPFMVPVYGTKAVWFKFDKYRDTSM